MSSQAQRHPRTAWECGLPLFPSPSQEGARKAVLAGPGRGEGENRRNREAPLPWEAALPTPAAASAHVQGCGLTRRDWMVAPRPRHRVMSQLGPRLGSFSLARPGPSTVGSPPEPCPLQHPARSPALHAPASPRRLSALQPPLLLHRSTGREPLGRSERPKPNILPQRVWAAHDEHGLQAACLAWAWARATGMSYLQAGVSGANAAPQREIQCLAEMLQRRAYKYL